jgi:multicomponent Na+:H+ antiporter subunit D
MSVELPWAILAPLLGAGACLFAGHRARSVAVIAAASTVSVVLVIAARIAEDGPLRAAIGGHAPPLGITLRADGIALAMVLATSVVGALIAVHAIGDRAARSRRFVGRFFSLWFFTWAALHALFLSSDVFNLYVALELTTLAAVALIAIDGRRPAVQAGFRYLLLALPGSLAYLLGVALLYGRYATLDLPSLGERLVLDDATAIALALMTAGLCLKAALFPLHAWLPAAYLSASPSVSAVLSALIGKSSFYVLLRLWLDVFPEEHQLRAGPLLGALGAAGVVWGSLMALRQRRLKALIAYSSISQIGYLFLLFPIFPLGGQSAWVGGVYLALSHAAAKASMFLSAGLIHRTLGHDEVHDLKGLAQHLPVTFFAFALAGVSLMGMPPSGGFVAKWMLVRAAFEGGQPWWGAIILAGGLLTAVYVFRVLRSAFLPLPLEPTVHVHRGLQFVALALALIAVLLGIAPMPLLGLLAAGAA